LQNVSVVVFGHPVVQKVPPTFSFNEKGGTDNTEFSWYLLDLTHHEYIQIELTYLDNVCWSSSLRRNSEDLKVLLQTEGVYLHMGVPNGMAVSQEIDQQSNYGTFKPSLCQNWNQLFSYQSKHHTQLEGRCHQDQQQGQN
jgi:hypothetical protein